MGNSSAIEWTDATWNPVTGCSHVSDGCRFCYAETYTRRMAEVWKVPDLPWTAGNAAENVILHPERLDWPLGRRKPAMVFVNSMSDLFHELVPPGFIAEVLAVMTLAPRHTFQVLTKRPDRMRELLTDARFWLSVADRREERGGRAGAANLRRWALDGDLPELRNVWLGVSIESSRHVDRADVLRETPAAHRFISAEPLLGPLVHDDGCLVSGCCADDAPGRLGWADGATVPELALDGIDWLIAGGESGQHYAERPDRFLVEKHRVRKPQAARSNYRIEWRPKPEAIGWVRDLRDACDAAGTAFFFKQWGGIQPKSAGRDLDGRTYDGGPVPAHA